MNPESTPVINTALLSFGMSGRVFHAPFIHLHPGFNLLGSWERSDKKITRAYPSTSSFDTLEQILEDPVVDLVIVNTPTLTHYDYARQALLHGKHVVVEKAFAGNVEEAIELRDLAEQQQCRLAVFQNRRWDSDFLAVKEILKQGVLGDIVEANLAYSRYDPGLSPKSHKEEPNSGSGNLKDLGPHVIDQALVLFGMPEAVFADIGITRDYSKVDDYFDILLSYADKRVHVKSGYFYKQPLPEFTLFGKKGCFIKSRADAQESQLDSGMTPDDDAYGMEPDSAVGLLYTGEVGENLVQKIPSPRGNYAEFYTRIYESIVHDQPEPVPADDGVRVMKVIDAAEKSCRKGRMIAI